MTTGEDTRVRIGAGGRWANEGEPPAPERKTQPIKKEDEPTPPVVHALDIDTLPDDNLADLPRPRSYQDILAEKGEKNTPPSTPQKKMIRIPAAIWLMMVGVTVLTATTALIALLSSIGGGLDYGAATGLNTNSTSVSSVQPEPSQTNLTAIPSGSGMEVGAVIDQGKPSEFTIIEIGTHSLLTKMKNGLFGVVTDKANPCRAVFWSPIDDWGTQGMAKYKTEQAGCYEAGKELAILGYWKDTGWFFFQRPKSATADKNKPEDWDNVWSVADWYGITLDEIKKLPNAKDFARPAAPPVAATPVPQPPQQGDWSPPAEPAPAAQNCTPERANAVVSDLKGTYYGCEGMPALLAEHPGAQQGDAAQVMAQQATANAVGAVATAGTQAQALAAQQRANDATAAAVQARDQAILDQRATAAALSSQQTAQAAPQATADAMAALQAAKDALDAARTPTSGPIKCVQCHN